MPRFHVGINGPAPCRARVRPCPIGGPSGDANHYANEDEAYQAYETLMKDEEYCARMERLSHMSLTKPEAVAEAKKTSDPEYLRDLYQYVQFKGGSENLELEIRNNEAAPEDLLTSFYREYPAKNEGRKLVSVLRHKNFTGKHLDPDNDAEVSDFVKASNGKLPESVMADRDTALASIRRFNNPATNGAFMSGVKTGPWSFRMFPPNVLYAQYIERYGVSGLTDDERRSAIRANFPSGAVAVLSAEDYTFEDFKKDYDSGVYLNSIPSDCFESIPLRPAPRPGAARPEFDSYAVSRMCDEVMNAPEGVERSRAMDNVAAAYNIDTLDAEATDKLARATVFARDGRSELVRKMPNMSQDTVNLLYEHSSSFRMKDKYNNLSDEAKAEIARIRSTSREKNGRFRGEHTITYTFSPERLKALGIDHESLNQGLSGGFMYLSEEGFERGEAGFSYDSSD